MTILVLRHADAGSRGDWEGRDHLRPLSGRGRQQADRLVEQYRARRIERILTSPFTRCIQTVQPLADARGLPVEEEDAIAEGAPLAVVQELVRDLGDTDAVLCSHGDVIHLLLTDLSHRDVAVRDPLRWEKGSTWALDGGTPLTTATYLPPPA